MRLLVEGIPRRVIAKSLFVSYKSVENHASMILEKLSLHNMRELTQYAGELGLIDLDIRKA